MRDILIVLIVALLAMQLVACSKKTENVESDESPYTFRRDGLLQVVSPQGEVKAEFEIEIARTELATMQGLKYRESMEKNQGMLFILSGTRPHEFWMQDTYMSLDIIYIGRDYEIFQIYDNTEPFSEELLYPKDINLFTLELIAGAAQEFDIKEGDTIQWQED